METKTRRPVRSAAASGSLGPRETFHAGGAERIRQAASRVVASPYTAPAIIAFGVALRVVRYFHERSLWLDEAQLALNLKDRSYGELFDRLDFGQGGPVGFLALEKFVISVLGDSERAFRFIPLLAGIGSIFVFWLVAPR